jgi:FixJ family two-component response regulator
MGGRLSKPVVRVIVVDDDAVVRSTLKQLLESQGSASSK